MWHLPTVVPSLANKSVTVDVFIILKILSPHQMTILPGIKEVYTTILDHRRVNSTLPEDIWYPTQIVVAMQSELLRLFWPTSPLSGSSLIWGTGLPWKKL